MDDGKDLFPTLVEMLAVVIGFEQSELMIPDDVLATVQDWCGEDIPVADFVTAMVREFARPENAGHLAEVLAGAARLVEDQS